MSLFGTGREKVRLSVRLRAMPPGVPEMATVLAAAGLLTLSGCNVVKAPWDPGAPLRSDTAAAASPPSADSAPDTATDREGRTERMSPEAAEAMRAAAREGDPARRGARREEQGGEPGDSIVADAARVPTTVEGLKEAGPTFVRYDEGPELQRTDRLTELLESRLLPVIVEHDLSPRTSTLFWVLVTPEGSVADVKVHSTSTVEAFDEAAAEVARSLVYRPARRGGQRVPVWVLARVHLLMP